MRASVLSSRNCVGAARFSTLRRPFFAFAIWLSLLAPAQAARILAKQAPPVVRWAMMPLFSLGMDFKEHPQYAYMKLKSIQEAVAKFGRP